MDFLARKAPGPYLFPPEVVEKLSLPNEYGVVGEFRAVVDPQKSCAGRLVLENNYRTADPEEVPCTFLDPHRGCILKPEDKPFDCSIWPLRIMNKDGELVIALTPTCPSIGAVPSQVLTELVKSGLGEKILEYAKKASLHHKGISGRFPDYLSLAREQ